ncbi:MAG: CHAT domain-containing protein [Saprospiraceae bacterium]|nr:CHAT domain-containing protein [Saprospiraceae bacterium]
MKSLFRHPLSIFILSLVFVWFVHSQTTVDPVDALYEQYDNALALFETHPNQTEQSLQELESALKLKEPSLTAADLWHDLGRFYYDQKANYTKALVCFENAFAIRQKQLFKDPANNDLARSQFMLGATHKYLGHYETALKHIEQAIKISESGHNTFMLAKEYIELGDISDYLSDYDQSIIYYDQAYPNILKSGRDQANLLSQYYKRLANVYLSKEQHKASIAHNFQALHIFMDSITSSNKDFFNSEIASCYTNMNTSYRAQKQYDSAHFCLQQALVFYKKSKIGDGTLPIGNVYNEIGDLFLSQKKYNEALKSQQKAIAILKPFPTHRYLSSAYASAGEVLLLMGKTSDAMSNFQRALDIAVPNFPPSVSSITTVTDKCLIALNGIARCYLADKKTDVALHYFRQLDTLMTNLRTSFKEDGSKFNLSKEALPIYENAIEAALTIGDTAAALDFCERNKAVVLREALQDVNAKLSLKLAPSVSAHEKALKERISYYQKQRFDANDSLRGIWQDSIQRTKTELEALIKELERAEPEYFVQKYAPIRSLAIADIQKNLPSDMLFLEYFMGDNQLFIFAITKNKAAVYPLTLLSLSQTDAAVLPLGFRDSIQVFLQNIKNPSPDAAILNRCATTSYALYNWLLRKPIDDFNADGHITRLRIVPDGILNYIPFDALTEQPTTDMKRRDVAYVLKHYAVSYILSNQLLSPTVVKNNWSFFTKTNFGGFGINYQNTPLSKLPFAESEVQQLQKKLGGDAFTQTKNKTLRSIFLEKANDYKILHLSMHGTVDDKEPMKSALQFVNEKDSLDPLLVIDAQNLELTNNELTVLSACNTGTGTLQRGEGIMSLSRAFAQAGCRSLVMSLWTLQDAYTNEIIDNFYDNLLKKQPKDVALAEAKRLFLNADQSERRAPNYWASLVVIGSVEEVQLSQSHKLFWLVVLSALVSCIWFWRKVFQKKIATSATDAAI